MNLRGERQADFAYQAVYRYMINLINEVSLDMPWALVESFATMPRWRPEDVNRGVDTLVQRLRGAYSSR